MAAIPRLRDQPGYGRFWTASAISDLGTPVTTLALSVLVVTDLQASATQLGLVNAARWVPYLVFGLLAGVLIDRARRRFRILVGCDLARALLLGTIPVLDGLDRLNLVSVAMVGVPVRGGVGAERRGPAVRAAPTGRPAGADLGQCPDRTGRGGRADLRAVARRGAGPHARRAICPVGRWAELSRRQRCCWPRSGSRSRPRRTASSATSVESSARVWPGCTGTRCWPRWRLGATSGSCSTRCWARSSCPTPCGIFG